MNVFEKHETHLMGEGKRGGEERVTWNVNGIGEDDAQNKGIYQ